MRLGFAIAAFLDADILLLDEVFAVGDEAFQQTLIFAFLQGERRDDRVRLTRRLGGRAVVRALRLPRGAVGSPSTADAGGCDSIPRALADDANPAERGVGLREWGSARR